MPSHRDIGEKRFSGDGRTSLHISQNAQGCQAGWHHPVFASRYILDHKNAKTFCVYPITCFGGVFPDYKVSLEITETYHIRNTYLQK